jgi:hypothetical protein
LAAGPGGVGPGGHVPFSAEWLRQVGKKARKQATAGSSEASEASESASLSEAAQKLAITKDEKMLQAMKAELAGLDPEADSFMEEATGKLIDSVIDQEYGESFKKKPGYENLQDKLMSTILSNEASRDAVADFFELLLLAEELNEEDEYDEEDEDPEDEEGSFEEYEDEEEPYEEE